jgi:hypothetical protein
MRIFGRLIMRLTVRLRDAPGHTQIEDVPAGAGDDSERFSKAAGKLCPTALECVHSIGPTVAEFLSFRRRRRYILTWAIFWRKTCIQSRVEKMSGLALLVDNLVFGALVIERKTRANGVYSGPFAGL